ncbi:MAG: S1 RNA-binding domain-containing protein [bacterium]|nr:S1 RNA-binding domain-containing protein [bacterium]
MVDLGGHRAFCPISQIDDQFVNDPPAWVGRSLEFRVIEFADGGRRLVVSRRALLQEEKARLGKETRKTLAVGDVRDGKVVRLMPYGAFIDIGGVEGLVHVSEISHHRIADPTEVLQEARRSPSRSPTCSTSARARPSGSACPSRRSRAIPGRASRRS